MCFVWLGSANFFVSPMEFNFLTYIDSGNIIAMYISIQCESWCRLKSNIV